MSLPEESALTARALSASYGSLVVCRDISVDVKPGEVVALTDVDKLVDGERVSADRAVMAP